MPGKKWSAPLLVGSIGTRVLTDQLAPSVEVLITTSLLVDRNDESCQTTYIFPALSIAAEGRMSPAGSPPPTVWVSAALMWGGDPKLAPPLVERNATTSLLSKL